LARNENFPGRSHSFNSPCNDNYFHHVLRTEGPCWSTINSLDGDAELKFDHGHNALLTDFSEERRNWGVYLGIATGSKDLFPPPPFSPFKEIRVVAYMYTVLDIAVPRVYLSTTNLAKPYGMCQHAFRPYTFCPKFRLLGLFAIHDFKLVYKARSSALLFATMGTRFTNG
jgi:hypothetical protein